MTTISMTALVETKQGHSDCTSIVFHSCEHIVNRVVFEIFNHQNRAVLEKYSCPVCGKLARKCSLIREDQEHFYKDKTPIPFPGETYRLQFVSGSLSIDFDNNPPYKTILFMSPKLNTLIKSFQFFQYKDGSIKMWINFERGNEEFAKYLKEFGINLTDSEISIGQYKTRTLSDAKNLFKIFVRNKLIQREYLMMMSIPLHSRRSPSTFVDRFIS